MNLINISKNDVRFDVQSESVISEFEINLVFMDRLFMCRYMSICE